MSALTAAALLAALLVPTSAGEAAPTCLGVPATIVGTDSDDRLVGTPGADVIVALGGDDDVRGLGGDDLLCGGRGADTVSGGPDDDRLVAGTGRDTLYGDSGDDDLRAAGSGPVELFGGQGDDAIVLVLPTAPVFMVDGASGTDRVAVRSPGVSGRATWNASTSEVTRDGSLWGRIGTVDRVTFSGDLDWTCRRPGPVVVRGC